MKTIFYQPNVRKLLMICSLSFLTINSAIAQFEEQTGITLTGSGTVAWGDYNNDGFLDILIGSKIYKNNGDGTFSEQTGISLPIGSGVWGDYNNDGFLDILFTSNYPGGINAVKIYKNNGDGTFSETGIVLNGFNATWGDYNNDGFLDISVTTFYGCHIIIYKSNGDGTFTEINGIQSGEPGHGTVASWGDYNNDGFLDILYTAEGWATMFEFDPISKIYTNKGDGTFSETGISLSGVWGVSLMWGDYNNDGFLDILLTGYVSNDVLPIYFGNMHLVSKIYKNNGNGTFSEQPGDSLPNGSSVAWGDYDNDGNLDILWVGSGIAKIYKNVYNIHNIRPSAPTNLQQTVTSNSVTLKWDKATDPQTPQNGLSYNVRMGTTPSGVNIVSPMASVTDGFRRIPAIGNAFQNTSFLINNLSAGTYYWSVQAIDNAFAGGVWAAEQSFSISTVDIKDINVNCNIKFYPNPAKDFITIIKEKAEPCLITLTDIHSKIVLSRQITEKQEDIPLYNLQSGLYILKLQTNRDVKVSKLVIE